MADPREDSVLVNLRALRELEHDRQREEAEEQRRRDEQARLALLEAERLRREEAQRITRQAEARRLAEVERRERQRHEEELRLAEVERLARVEAEARLAEEQLRLEHQARLAVRAARPKWPMWVAALALLAGAGAGGVAWDAHRRSEAADARRREAEQALVAARAAADDLRVRNQKLAGQIEDAKRLMGGLEAGPAPAPKPEEPKPTAQPGKQGPSGVKQPPKPPKLVEILVCPEGKPLCQESEKVPLSKAGR